MWGQSTGSRSSLDSLNRSGRTFDADEIAEVLKQYGLLLTTFRFDKARECVDGYRSKRQNYNHSPKDIAWLALLQALVHLAQVEKAYVGLSFLQPKLPGFLNFNQKTNFNQVRSDLLRASDTLKAAVSTTHGTDQMPLRSLDSLDSSTSRSGSYPTNDQLEAQSSSLIDHLLCHYSTYVSARIDLMNFYEKLALLANSDKGPTIEQAIEILNGIQTKYAGGFHHPLCANLEGAFNTEAEVLLRLLRCQCMLPNLEFLSSLLQLKETAVQLTNWLGGCSKWKKEQNARNATSWFATFGGSTKRQGQMALCSWLMNFYNILISKFGLYFYDVLSKQTTAAEMQKQIGNIPSPNFIQMLSNFSKKQDCLFASVLANGTEIRGFNGIGYRHPDRTGETIRGLEQYPLLFTVAASEKQTHQQYQPAIAMTLDRHREYLATQTGRPVYMYDEQKQQSLYVARVEQCVYLAVVLSGRKPPRGDAAISQFIVDFCTEINCTKLFVSLKSGGPK